MNVPTEREYPATNHADCPGFVMSNVSPIMSRGASACPNPACVQKCAMATVKTNRTSLCVDILMAGGGGPEWAVILRVRYWCFSSSDVDSFGREDQEEFWTVERGEGVWR
jgi:hypothetical protein